VSGETGHLSGRNAGEDRQARLTGGLDMPQLAAQILDLRHRSVPVGAERRLPVAPGTGLLELALEIHMGVHAASLLTGDRGRIARPAYVRPGPSAAPRPS